MNQKKSRPVKSGPSLKASEASGVKRTEPGYRLLLNAMGNVRRTEADWPFWTFDCVCSNEDHRGRLEYRQSKYADEGNKLLFRCQKKSSGQEVVEQLGLNPQSVWHTNSVLDKEVGMRRPSYKEPLPPPREHLRRQARLLSGDAALEYLTEQRGLDLKTIEDFEIGWDGLYYLPVRDSEGALVGERRYNRFAPLDVPKMKNLAGRSAKHLYPNFPEGDWVLLCEGEWDALLARRHSLPSLTTTGGANCWDTDWNRLFHGLLVAIVYDCDVTGRTESVRRAGQLVGVASAIKVVDLGLADKEDLTDWFVKYRRTSQQLKQLIRSSEQYRG